MKARAKKAVIAIALFMSMGPLLLREEKSNLSLTKAHKENLASTVS
jgi:hypothetical protein